MNADQGNELIPRWRKSEILHPYPALFFVDLGNHGFD
jgi:hypothetical protein